MRRLRLALIVACVTTAALGNALGAGQELSAAQIVEKNIAARGGLEAWKKIQTMAWIGHIERASAGASSMPYVLEQKRPNMTRFEIKAQNQVGVRIYDGMHGWKLRPASNGIPEVRPYTAAELSYARDEQCIDGPLLDYQGKGITVALEGSDEVEGHKAYRLLVRLPSGASQHVWIDAQTFLELKSARSSRDASGRVGRVTVAYRNYQTIEGLQIPLLIETGSDAGAPSDKMIIDKVVLNPPLDDQQFTQPRVPGGRNAVLVDTTSARTLPPGAAWPADQPNLGRNLPIDSTGTP